MIRLNAYPRPRLVLWVALACVALPRLPPAQGDFELKSPVARGQLARNGFLTGDKKIIDDEDWMPQWFCAPEDECNVCGQKRDRYLPGGEMFIPRVTKFYPNDTKPSVILHLEQNYGGYFEFRLCNRRNNGPNVTKPFNQDCFDEHVLKIDESRIWYDFHIKDKDTRFYIDRITDWQTIEIPLLWPTEDFICKKCILQTNYYPAEEVTFTGWECPQYEEYFKKQIELGFKSITQKRNCSGGRVMRACSDIAVSKHHGKYANKEAIREWFLNENGTLDYQSNWTIIWAVDEAPRIIGEDTWDTWDYSTPSPEPEFPLVVAECKCNCPSLFD